MDIPEAVTTLEQLTEEVREEADNADCDQRPALLQRIEALNLAIGLMAAQQTEAVCQLGF